MKIKIKYPFMSEQQANEVMSVLREHCRKYNASYKFSIGEPDTVQATVQATAQATDQAPKRKFEKCIYLIHFTDGESRVRHIRELMAKLDAEGWKRYGGWNKAEIEVEINDPDYVFLICYKDGDYSLMNHDCNIKQEGFPLYHWCGSDPAKHRPKVKVGDRVVATTELEDSRGTYPIGFSWDIKVVYGLLGPFLPNREPVGYNEGYRLATKYDV